MGQLPPDPYQALGVTRDAQLPEIRSAHRKLVLKCHPDKVQDPLLKAQKADEFQKVQQAYEILSNERERHRYDVMKDLADLKEEREQAQRGSRMSANSRTPHRQPTAYYDVHTAEPRRGSYSSSPSSEKVYSRTPPRSYEDVPSSHRREPEPRSSKKSDREREREREREKEREKVAEKERRRQREEEKVWERESQKKKEKEEKKKKEREDRDKDKKKRDKDRKKDADEKSRHKTYTETFDEDEEAPAPTSKSEKKKSSSRKYDEARDDTPPPSQRERKQSFNMDFATQYLSRSGATIPQMKRAATATAATVEEPAYYAPTPPPAGSPFAPPGAANIAEEDASYRRSSKSSRHPPSSRDKTAHKKSSGRDRSRDPGNPTIIDAHHPPAFTKSRTMPTEYVRSSLHRSNTEQYTRTPPTPSFHRADTYHGQDPDRARSRSRHERVISSSDDSSDDEQHIHRTRRGQTPEEPLSSTTRYTVTGGKTTAMGSSPIPINVRNVQHPDESSPRSRSHKKGMAYVVPEHHGYSNYGGDHQNYGSKYTPSKVQYAHVVEPDGISFAHVPHSRSYEHTAY